MVDDLRNRPRPWLETLSALAEYLERDLSDAELAAAAAALAKLRPGLLRLRRIQFDYTGEVIEPAFAFTWLEGRDGPS